MKNIFGTLKIFGGGGLPAPHPGVHMVEGPKRKI